MPDFQQKIDETMKMGLEIVKESDEDRFMTLSVGPQHGVLGISDLQ